MFAIKFSLPYKWIECGRFKVFKPLSDTYCLPVMSLFKAYCDMKLVIENKAIQCMLSEKNHILFNIPDVMVTLVKFST